MATPPTGLSFATLGDFIGKEIGTSRWEDVDQQRIDGFADFTGDRQWILVSA